jgi:hypothetical protein
MKSHSYVERTRKDNELKSPVEVPPQNKETNEEVLPKNINTNRSEIENVIETDGERKRERQEIESNVTRSKDSSGNDVITFEVKTRPDKLLLKDSKYTSWHYLFELYFVCEKLQVDVYRDQPMLLINLTEMYY